MPCEERSFAGLIFVLDFRSDLIVEGTGYYLVLLFLCELDEVYRIAAYTDGKLGIFFGVRLSIEKRFSCENVDVQVVAALLNVAVKECDKIIYLVFCCYHFVFFLSLEWGGDILAVRE